jgi:hypothetical protein
MSASSNAFVCVALGPLTNAINLLVPVALPVQAALDLKAGCYDFFSNLLLEHASLLSSAKLVATLNGHVPSTSYNAALEVASCCDAGLLLFAVEVATEHVQT